MIRISRRNLSPFRITITTNRTMVISKSCIALLFCVVPLLFGVLPLLFCVVTLVLGILRFVVCIVCG